MTYVVTENCIACKYTDCVDSCPVDCFHEGENMLVINPDECIDCGVCVPECPADAIVADTSELAGVWTELNEKYARVWPILYDTKEPLKDADAMEGVAGKLDSHFTESPGHEAA